MTDSDSIDILADYKQKVANYPGGKTSDEKLDFESLKNHYFVQDEKKRFDVQATANRFKYLLSLTPLFKHFLKVKAKKDDDFLKVLEIIENDSNVHHQLNGNKNNVDHRRRRTEKEEDAELMKDEENETDDKIQELELEGEFTDSGYEFSQSPRYINGSLRPYQIQGLNWLVSLNTNDLSGILADEMGLGKTLQTISFLGYLRYIKNIKGPHIVIVPKSTLENWQREFSKWTPEVKTCVLTGDQVTRNSIIKNNILNCQFDVLISSYEIVIREKSILKKINWQYIIVDEAHRLKNEDSLLSQIIRMFHSKNRLLITGTPLQNNLHELWALLNFLLPDIFSDSTTFDEWFSNDEEEKESNDDNENENDKNINNENNKDKIVQQLHQVLKPFLLRRIKNDVEKSLLPKQELNLYVGMTPMQRKWYQSILEKDIDAVNGANGKKESKTRLLNIVMQLRKCCNHPYLFEGAEPGPPYTTDEHLVYNSQKMLVLDKLLKKLRKQGSRILIFSQMSRMLDILEDYCAFREWGYCRIDGQTEHTDRIIAIDEYNKPDSDKFIFLLTTRAGGLGINLTSADIVILFDSDWNPQADLQAMDRAHRIGQKKQVKVFRFVTENAIEEKVLERASQKLRLDQLVIQQGRSGISNNNDKKASTASNKDELLNMIQHGAASILSTSYNNINSNQANNNDSNNYELNDDELDKILMKSEEKTGELKSKFSKLGLDDLQNFSSNNESVYEWNGKNFQKKEFKGESGFGGVGNGFNWISLAKRERKGNYSVDGYYREVLQTGGRVAANSSNNHGEHITSNDDNDLKPPKHLSLYDHQFYSDKLHQLYELEWAYYKRVCKIKAKNEKNKSEEDVIIEQAMIDHARPLTEEEEELKKELLIQGFSNWSRRDFFSFISANAKHSRYDLKAISEEFKNDKTYEEVKEYAEKFWNNFRDIENYERYIGQIEVGEDKLRKIQLQKEALRRKVASYEYPMRDMEFKLPYTATSKKEWNDYEDRWLVIQMLRIGIENDDLFEQIFNEIQFGNSLVVEMDFWLQSRNVAEIGRRCQTLLGAIVKEAELLASAKAKAKSKAKSKANSKSVKSSKKQLKTKKTTTNTTDSTNKGRKRGRSEVENNKNKNKNKKRR
jgi:SWI/SNF-related matrix-associated actin-dependent regulator of chromatin subfamily A member 5